MAASARRVAAVLVVLVASGAVAACGDGAAAGNANVADIQAVVAQVASGNIVNRSQATCIADRAVPKLSKQGLKDAKDSSKGLSDLSKADQAAVYQSFSACVTTAQLAPAISKSLSASTEKVAPSSARCFTSKLAERFPRSGDLVKAMEDGDASVVTSAVASCIPSDQIEQSLIQSMTSGGYTKAQATCVVQKVLAEVPLTQFTNGTSSSLPADVEAKIVAATQACERAG